MRALAFLWAAPCTALGLLLAWAGGCRRTAGGLEFLAPRRGPWRRFFAQGWAAITIGEVIVFADAEAQGAPWVQAHERRHVEQYRRLGPLFPVVYATCSVLALAMGRDPYRDNWLEIDASLAANERGY